MALSKSRRSVPPKRYDVVDEHIQFPPRARLEQKALGSPATQATSEGSSHSKILTQSGDLGTLGATASPTTLHASALQAACCRRFARVHGGFWAGWRARRACQVKFDLFGETTKGWAGWIMGMGCALHLPALSISAVQPPPLKVQGRTWSLASPRAIRAGGHSTTVVATYPRCTWHDQLAARRRVDRERVTARDFRVASSSVPSGIFSLPEQQERYCLLRWIPSIVTVTT
ncbi:hypothetical protein K456DRAFT_35127 [Colletotrichum gloeosporioides 23]|nr:hypothetical protein K456DRAFT_35127 [Colletotrichum gloeosporioides 23]